MVVTKPINTPALRKRVSAGVDNALRLVKTRFIASSTLIFTFVLWRISHDTVSALLNAKEGAEKDKLIILWRESKLQELGVVIISVSTRLYMFCRHSHCL